MFFWGFFGCQRGLRRYEALSSRMEGAPEEAAEAEFWATTLAELKEAHGADQVDELM